MARYAIECAVDPGKLDILAARRAEHYEFLIAHRSDIVFGGPARGHPDGPPETMIIIVEVPNPEAAQRFIDAEPYNRGGGFTRVTVRPWSQVLPEPAPGSLQRILNAERVVQRDDG